MTDEEFDKYFKRLTHSDKFKWLSRNIVSVTLRNGKIYGCQALDDLNAVIEQELYQEKTGRE